MIIIPWYLKIYIIYIHIDVKTSQGIYFLRLTNMGLHRTVFSINLVPKYIKNTGLFAMTHSPTMHWTFHTAKMTPSSKLQWTWLGAIISWGLSLQDQHGLCPSPTTQLDSFFNPSAMAHTALNRVTSKRHAGFHLWIYM